MGLSRDDCIDDSGPRTGSLAQPLKGIDGIANRQSAIGSHHSSYCFIKSVPLVPPNPNEFESA